MKVKSKDLIEKCLDEIYRSFDEWNEDKVREAYNLLEMPQAGLWNRVLYWAGLEPVKIDGKYYFKKDVEGEDVYCRFSSWSVDDGETGLGEDLNFYIKDEEEMKKIGVVPKFCVEAKIRGLKDKK